jgi:hypothetical protein
MQASNLGGLCPSRRCASPVLPFGLSLGDAFSLPQRCEIGLARRVVAAVPVVVAAAAVFCGAGLPREPYTTVSLPLYDRSEFVIGHVHCLTEANGIAGAELSRATMTFWEIANNLGRVLINGHRGECLVYPRSRTCGEPA